MCVCVWGGGKGDIGPTWAVAPLRKIEQRKLRWAGNIPSERNKIRTYMRIILLAITEGKRRL